ncbi:hypothetical protein K701_18245 [Streptomyces fradiae ATCC 10745 = DSM 40063]|uniref:Integral membrane protein n=1 Tax=Streptomyces fradiae ATCC 10745 = DSM 40063 TaxID=1319510 RepID=A0A1Y2P3L2_STRFR|nr:hypothetical protein K701_18245 [Streptomyces fradiae ATCC 10745 = DSM 40063]OSY53817.1 hypothetical protein BG846_00514 [Streptomyces fradiae ATCC 10745 = DSM 40063]
MGHWFMRDIVEPGKLPLLLALASFVATFLVTRTVTRLIRAGRGPFRDVSTGGVHIHHVVPGVVLTLIGGFGAIGAQGQVAAAVCAVVFGVGAGLVLDEFALILHLADVYWTEQGRQSVEAVVLTTALVALVLSGAAPLGVDELTPEERRDRLNVLLTVVVNLLFVVVALVKGKLRTAVIGTLVPLVAVVGAVRLARPDSPWARRFYRRRPRARSRARRRADRHDRRWAWLGRGFQELIAGTPDPVRPARPPDGADDAGGAVEAGGADGAGGPDGSGGARTGASPPGADGATGRGGPPPGTTAPGAPQDGASPGTGSGAPAGAPPSVPPTVPPGSAPRPSAAPEDPSPGTGAAPPGAAPPGAAPGRPPTARPEAPPPGPPDESPPGPSEGPRP